MEISKIWEYLGENPSESIIKEVEEWSAECSENLILLEELYYLKHVSNTVDVLYSIDTAKAFKQVDKKIKRPRYSISSWFNRGVAALFIGIFCIAGALGLNSWTRQEHQFITSLGDKVQLILPDESHIWMNASSQLSYTTSLFGFNRKVHLEGEAYFEVSKRKFNTFEVQTKNIITRVLGTRFNLRFREEENKVVTTLLEGSVEVEILNADKKLKLLPGQSISISTQNNEFEIIDEEYPSDYTLWIEGNFSFKQAPLEYILQTFEKHYNVKFIYSEDVLKNIKFTCDFSAEDSIDQLLNIISLTRKVQFKHKEGTIYSVESFKN
ncbi:FecR family protein [Bacteroides sp.]|uniref:FecR family protein n=1 Tax=Bacteroides sp. TaxID=29523 RepID=UPI002590D285|nr:FecR family protein [Bacteroides sp.]